MCLGRGIVSKWKERAKTKHVYTPQTILKKDVLPIKPTAIVVDEAHMWATTLFKAKTRSKCGERLYEYIKNNPDVDILLLTATPVRANPWNLHTLLALKGHYVPYKEWQDKYFYPDKPFYLPRPAYFAVDDWRKQMQELSLIHI